MVLPPEPNTGCQIAEAAGRHLSGAMRQQWTLPGGGGGVSPNPVATLRHVQPITGLGRQGRLMFGLLEVDIRSSARSSPRRRMAGRLPGCNDAAQAPASENTLAATSASGGDASAPC